MFEQSCLTLLPDSKEAWQTPRIVDMKAVWRKIQGRRCISLSGWFCLMENQTTRQICTCGGQTHVFVHKETVNSTPGMSVRVCVCTVWEAVHNVIGSNNGCLVRQTLLSDMFTTGTRSVRLHRQTSQWDYKLTDSLDMCSLAIISLKLPLNCAPLLTYHMQINHWF